MKYDVQSMHFVYTVYTIVYFSYGIHIFCVHCISYIVLRIYTDTQIRSLLFISLKIINFHYLYSALCHTCKCLLKNCTDNVQQGNSLWGSFKLVNPNHETRLHLVCIPWFNFHAIFDVPTTYQFSWYRKYKPCFLYEYSLKYELSQLNIHCTNRIYPCTSRSCV